MGWFGLLFVKYTADISYQGDLLPENWPSDGYRSVAGRDRFAGGRKAVDPFGARVMNVQPPDSTEEQANIHVFGPPYSTHGWSTFTNANNFSTGCTLDGVRTTCKNALGQVGNGIAFLRSISTTGLLADLPNGGLGGLIGAIRTGYKGVENDKKYSFLDTDKLNIGPAFDREAQNPTVGEDIKPRNLLANIFHLLDDNRCSTFVSNLINVARQLTGLKPFSYDGKELAIAVANQEGIILRPGIDGGGGGGSAYGDIFSGAATAQIVMFNTAYGPRHPVRVQISYALTALHEIIHLAGGAASLSDGSRAYYMDVVLARAAHILTGAPDYPGGYDPDRPWWEITAAMTKAAGDYWDKQLVDHCAPQEYRSK